MSSFLVYYSKQNNTLPKFFKDFSKIKFSDFFIFYKDNANTLIYNFDKKVKYILSGLAIGDGNNPTFLMNTEWEKIVSNSEDFVDKINGILYRKIISQEKPELKKLNLVKDYVEYPFSLGTVSSHLIRKMKSKYALVSKVDPIKHRMYDNLKEYLGDEINSNFVRENSCYNSKRIEMLFDEYYSGNKSKLAELDWWFSFNEWYKVMFGKN